MFSTILIVEDEVRSAHWLKTYLERGGFRAQTAYDGLEGLKMARDLQPDLILLDLMLPGVGGNELFDILRAESEVPIIMITARGSREDRLKGLNQGADDYIVKPFEPEEVILRVKAVLRRSRGTIRTLHTCGPLTLDEEKEEVRWENELLRLSHAQFAILTVFMRQPGVVLSRRQIIEQAFPQDFDAYERAIDTHIKRVRKIIHREGFEPIQTIYGGGYKLQCRIP